jgi:FkbM family methyltransferase
MDGLADFYRTLPETTDTFIESLQKRFGIIDLKDCNGAVIFGSENLGTKLAAIFADSGIHISGFCDNNNKKWGQKIHDIPIFGPADLSKNSRIIIASKYVREIKDQLIKNGVKNVIPHYVLSILYPDSLPNILHRNAFESIRSEKEKITKVYYSLFDGESKKLFLDLLKFRISLLPDDLPTIKHEQYYPGSFWILSDDETYVDVGAYDGDTLNQFINHSKGIFNKYIALEPDKKNFQELVKNIPGNLKDNIQVHCLGAGAERNVVSFSKFGRDDSFITENGEDKIEIISLDELCQDDKVTTVKIDVEGYEPDVLKGMKNIITSLKPKLAVCVYHRPSHLWDLALQIMDYNSHYNLYLRHHEPEIYGTVLYAI